MLGRSLDQHVEGAVIIIEVDLGEGLDSAVVTSATGAGVTSLRYAALNAVSKGGPMPTIYISDSGDDKNDGLSLKTPIYSLKQAKKLQGGKNDYSWHFGPRAWKRIQKELSDKKKKSD